MSHKQTMQRIASHPAEFRRALAIDTGAGIKRLADVLDDWQRADFEALDAAWMRVAGRGGDPAAKLRAYLERPRGHSKTADLAAMVSWALFSSPRCLSGVAAAADKDQARLLRDAIARLVRLNAWLGEAIEVQAYRIINKHTGSTLDILSCDVGSSYGLTPDFIIVDELSHWSSEELWASLVSSAAKRPTCMLVVISNAGFGQGSSWQWTAREACRADVDWYFSRLDGPRASWITEKQLAEQKRLLPLLAYDRLWLNRWTTGSGDALRETDIEAAVCLPGPLAEPEKGWAYVAGVDLGLKRDFSALAIVGRHVGHWQEVESSEPAKKPQKRDALSIVRDLEYEPAAADEVAAEPESFYVFGSQRFRLASLTVWRPGSKGEAVDVESIERAIIQADRQFCLSRVAFDPHEARFLEERLRKQDLPTELVDFTAGNLRAMASAVLECFAERQLDLYQHDGLLTDLRALRIEEKSYGVRLTSPRGPNGHGDAATALAIALHVARKTTATRKTTIDGPLVCWP